MKAREKEQKREVRALRCGTMRFDAVLVLSGALRYRMASLAWFRRCFKELCTAGTESAGVSACDSTKNEVEYSVQRS